MKTLLKATLMAAIILCLVQAAGAAVVTLTFDNVPADIKCDEVWHEGGIALRFTTAGYGECGKGSCYFGVGAPGQVALYPSTLAVDLSNVTGITSIEIDYIDWCGSPGCENVYLFNGQALVDEDHGNNNPLLVETGGMPVDLLRVNGCEDGFTEIRIIGENVMPTEPMTWGAIKAVHR